MFDLGLTLTLRWWGQTDPGFGFSDPKNVKSIWSGPWVLTFFLCACVIDYLLHNIELKSGGVTRVTHIQKIKRAFALKVSDYRENDTQAKNNELPKIIKN